MSTMITRKVLATRVLPESGKKLGPEGMLFKYMMEQWKKLEAPVLVLLSLAIQVILALLGNRRKSTKNVLLIAVLWSAYMVSDSVVSLALGVIWNHLVEAPTPLEPRVELIAFWAQILMLHLGGADTITAFQVEDNELWLRHLLSLGTYTVLNVYILFKAWKMSSSLSVLSGMMLLAGFIKYVGRTYSLWLATKINRQEKAEKALERALLDEIIGRGPPPLLQNNYISNLVIAATWMFLDTERMFEDGFIRNRNESKLLVELAESRTVMKVIEMELHMMYDNLYTTAKLMSSCTGPVFRFISFLLTCTTLILFSSSVRRKQHFHSIPEHSVTLLVLIVSVGLELYAAFVFLTSYRTISRFARMGMVRFARSLRYLAWLRTRDWSNSMGKFSEISYLLEYKSKRCQLMTGISLGRKKMSHYVYNRSVPDKLKHFIHGYVKKAYTNRCERQFPLLRSRGREPWHRYKEFSYTDELKDQLEEASLVFEKDFAEVIIFLHLATEICYYTDRPLLTDNSPSDENTSIITICKFSRYLSRYLMPLFVDSSDLLPRQTPLLKRFYEEVNHKSRAFLNRDADEVREREEKDDKKKRKSAKKQACCKLWEGSNYNGTGTEENSALQIVRNLLAVMKLGDHDADQLAARWEFLVAVWMELLVFAACQCTGRTHAQHLRQGGELLTHVWVLVGHFGFIDEDLRPLNYSILRERYKSLGFIPSEDSDKKISEIHSYGGQGIRLRRGDSSITELHEIQIMI